VKKTLLTTALAAALAAAPAIADKPKQPPRPPSEMALAVAALSKEFKPFTSTMSGDAGLMLEKLEAHQYGAASRERFAKVFGDPDAFKLRRTAAAPGEAAYTMGVKAHSHSDDDGTRFSWSDLDLTMTLDKTRRQLRSKGQLESLAIEFKDASVTMSGMTLSGKTQRGAGDIWFGSNQATIDRFAVSGKGQPFGIVMEEMSATAAIVPRAKVADLNYELRIKAIKAGDEQVDAVRMAMRINGIDIKALEALARESNQDPAGLTPQQQLELMMPRVRKMGAIMVRNGASIDIQEISAGYKGNRAVIKGRIAMPGAREGDLGSMASFAKKVQANIEIRVPVALIKDIANTFARKQIQSQNKNGASVSETAVAQAGQSMADVVMGKVLGEGYARVDNGVLVSRLAFKDGKLTVNGKALTLPSPRTPPALPAPRDPTSMKAREISDSCARAALPAETAEKGESLRTAVEVAVGADGKVRDVRLVASSGSRAFDMAVVKSAAACRWAPALAGGKEVDAKVVQEHVATPAAPQAVVSTVGR
jgi:TonB family protein